jgi:hypothetical protein
MFGSDKRSKVRSGMSDSPLELRVLTTILLCKLLKTVTVNSRTEIAAEFRYSEKDFSRRLIGHRCWKRAELLPTIIEQFQNVVFQLWKAKYILEM